MRNQVGELVVRAPWIGMTRGFWHDPSATSETYWSRLPDIWVHGDWAAIDDDGLWYILGRSDDTIKIAGKRLGPAEVESVLVEHPAVLEAGGDRRPRRAEGSGAGLLLRAAAWTRRRRRRWRDELTALVATRLGKPLKPQAVEFVARSAEDAEREGDAPRDPRRLPRRAALGDLSSLENPRAVDAIAALGGPARALSTARTGPPARTAR